MEVGGEGRGEGGLGLAPAAEVRAGAAVTADGGAVGRVVIQDEGEAPPPLVVGGAGTVVARRGAADAVVLPSLLPRRRFGGGGGGRGTRWARGC